MLQRVRNWVLVLVCTAPSLIATEIGGSETSGKLKPGLTMEARDFESDSGQAVLFLFRDSDKIPKEPFRKVTAKISGHRSYLAIPDVENGAYGAILLHDFNMNGIIDHSFGLPSEPLGFSNGWKLGLFSGMPTFRKLRFLVFDSNRTYPIPIVYRKK
jgi:uncharacterized protein (DUF2141 family)